MKVRFKITTALSNFGQMMRQPTATGASPRVTQAITAVRLLTMTEPSNYVQMTWRYISTEA